MFFYNWFELFLFCISLLHGKIAEDKVVLLFYLLFIYRSILSQQTCTSHFILLLENKV